MTRPTTTPPAVPSSLSPDRVHSFVSDLFAEDLHAKRVLLLANGVVGVLHSAALGIHAIGRGLASAMGLDPTHTTKQVDRLLGNVGVDPWELMVNWGPDLVRERPEIVVSLDWTEHDADDHTTCMLSLVTAHGRTTPMVWKTITKSWRAGRQFEVESEVIEHAHPAIPEAVWVTLLADRGFGDQARYAALAVLGWDWVIRFRGNIQVRNAQGEVRTAAQWVQPRGRPRRLADAAVTADEAPVPAVVVVKKAGMKEAWCLATSRADLPAAEVITLYSKRLSIEENFRDTKDPRFGLGLSMVRLGDRGRRDRMLWLATLAEALLTLLGAAPERTGLDKRLYPGTAKRRVHSLFSQGQRWYQLLPTLREAWLRPLMTAFGEILAEQQITRQNVAVL